MAGAAFVGRNRMRRLRASRRATWAVGWVLALTSAAACIPVVRADDRSDYLIRLLRTSDAFRVRAQAALSLGAVTPAREVAAALETALGDSSDVVRAAAAASLERTGDATSIAALRRVERDPVPAVRDAAGRTLRALLRAPAPSPSVAPVESGPREAVGVPATVADRYYVGVGLPGSRVVGLTADAMAAARTFLRERVDAMDGVVLAPDVERAREAQQVLRSRSLVGFYLDSSLVSLDQRPDGSVRAQVSVVVQSYPDRNVRSMLNGAATVSGQAGPAAQRAAIEGALEGAMRNLGTAFAAGAHP